MNDFQQLNLLAIEQYGSIVSVTDPYWDEIVSTPKNQYYPEDVNFDGGNVLAGDFACILAPSLACVGEQLPASQFAPQQLDDDRWNPQDFGEVPHKLDGDQLTIFYDDSHEPPDPDDYQSLQDYQQAWVGWRIRVGAQVSHSTLPTTVKTRVGAQVTLDTKKTAPQHDTHWIEKYWVERSGNKYWYYRYCWMIGRKKNRCYIGSVRSRRAIEKVAEVEQAIASDNSPGEILKIISQMSR